MIDERISKLAWYIAIKEYCWIYQIAIEMLEIQIITTAMSPYLRVEEGGDHDT